MAAESPALILSATASLCPVCLARLPATREQQGDAVFLVKHCPDHGPFRTLIWRGPILFASWIRPKIPVASNRPRRPAVKGCPFDCGLCANHHQQTCTALIEITSRCNLRCPVCFADAGGDAPTAEPSLTQLAARYEAILTTSGPCNIQLSGGEPSLREDLPEIIALGRDKGFGFIQLNTNGLRLGSEAGFAERLKQAGLASVFLQFDGLSSAVHLALRGRDLGAVKEEAIRRCGEAGLAVVLVPTLVPGINTHEVGAIIDYAAGWAPTVRGVHFQPISYFGRFPEPPAEADRLTLPELMGLIEEQSNGAIRATHLAPPGCEHALCSFHGNFLVEENGRLTPLGAGHSGCCPDRETTAIATAQEGRDQTIRCTARQWSPPQTAPVRAPKGPDRPLDDLDHFLLRARTHSFSLSAMAFQDAWNLDLERLRGCCIHVAAPDGRLIPFCAYNLTSSQGRPLHRRPQQP